MKYSMKSTCFGLLLLRVALGAVFIAHGYQKLTHLAQTKAFFAAVDIAPSLALVVGLVELVAGVLVLVGFLTRYAGIALAIVMIGAMITVKAKVGFIGGYEFDLTLMLAALALAFTGAGSYSIERCCGKNSCDHECHTCDTPAAPAVK